MSTLTVVAAMALPLMLLLGQRQRSQKQAHSARDEERDRLLHLFYDLPFMGMAIIDPSNGHWLQVNDRLCDILGYSRAELEGLHWEQLVHADDLPVCRGEYRRMLDGETAAYQLEKRLLRKDGTAVDVELSVRCVRDDAGGVRYVVKTLRDISEQKRLELARLEAQRATGLIDAIAEVSTDAIFVKDPAGKYLFCNNEAARLFNCTPREVIGRDDTWLYPPGQAARTLAQDGEVLAGGKPVTYEEVLSTVEGQRTFLTTKGPLLDKAGRQLGLFGIARDISARKDMEERLRHSQEQLQTFVEHAPVSIAMFDRSMDYLAYSRRWLQDYGRGHASLAGLNLYQVHPDMPDAWKSAHQRGLGGETLENEADHWIQADGSELWLRWAVLPWRDVAGRVGGVVISVEDITARMRAERELSRSRARLAGIINSAMDAIITLDGGQRISMFNPAAERMFGYRAEEMLGERIDRLIPERLRQAHSRHMQRFALEDVTSRDMGSLGELSALRRDGREFPIEASISKSEVDGERIFTIILRDTSERRYAAQALHDREEDLQRAQSVGRIGSWRLDVRSNALTWSHETHRIFGVPEGTPMTYEFFLSCVHPDDRSYVDRKWQAALLGGGPYDIEHRLLLPDGKVKWVREKAELEVDAGGNLLGGFGITQDISDIKAAEKALRDSEERLRWALEGYGGGAWDWDLVDGCAWWSTEMYALWGVEPGTRMCLENSLALVHELDRERVAATVQSCIDGHREYQCEFRIRHAALGERWMASRGYVIYEEAGRPLRFVGITQDTTERKKVEAQLREADQRKDEFLAMLSHELRNPLVPIRNAAHVLGLLDIHEPRLRWAQDLIERQVSHLTRLVDELLDLSRIARGKISIKKTRIAIADLLRQSCESVQPLMMAKGHQLVVRAPAGEIALQGDLVRLIQVLQNLLTNAAKYTPDKGHIELAAWREGKEVVIQVRDDGMGIPANLLPGVFELFRQGERTLDRAQGGLGIGLTLVHRLVELHGGRVEASSDGPGRGAVFSIHLPVSEQGAVAACAPDDRESLAQHGKPLRLLVVDDDPAVAESITVFLQMEGHQVRSAATGEAALGLLQSFRPQVVLLDIGLPGQDGYAVARLMRQAPGGDRLLLVAVSGYGHEEAIARSGQAGFDRHLIKPVDPEALLALLQEKGERECRTEA
jgi:PAS domain S-box-containing protein